MPPTPLKAHIRPHVFSGLRFHQRESEPCEHQMFCCTEKNDKYGEHSLLHDFFLLFFFTPDISDSIIQLICVAKATGLGLLIKGGANRADGPMVFIQELLPGGDCQKVIFIIWKNKLLNSTIGFFFFFLIATHEPDKTFSQQKQKTNCSDIFFRF